MLGVERNDPVIKRGTVPRCQVTDNCEETRFLQGWAREKGRAEQELATLAADSDLRTFSYRSAFVRPTAEQANVLDYVGEALLRPGKLVISADALGEAMLEISARTGELANGSLIDSADSIAYAEAYQAEQPKQPDGT